MQNKQQVPILNLRAQHEQVGQSIEQKVLEVLRSGNYILSENVTRLENEVAALCGQPFAVGVGNGTDALILSLWALDIAPGDEVITTSFTFAATIEAIVLRGATPVFVDIDETTFNMDVSKLEAAITDKTKAILPVHLYGMPSAMDKIMEIAGRHGLKVVEDNAQAIGASYLGRPTGSYGDLTCISFYPTKNLGAAGDAGIIVTHDEKLANRLRCLRAHGMHRRYYHDELGVNSRLDELQAAILVAKLPHLRAWNERRNEIARLYQKLLAGCPGIKLPAHPSVDVYHVWHQYTIRVQDQDQSKTGIENQTRTWLIEQLAAKGVGSMCYYPIPLHMQAGFDNLTYSEGDLPLTEKAASEVLSLPMYPELTDEQVEYVASCVIELMSQLAPVATTVSSPTSVPVIGA